MTINDDVLYGRHALENDVPYILPEAQAFLEGIARSWWRVFEWGAGGSTVWFGKWCKSVFSVEPRYNWVERLRPELDDLPGAILYHVPDLAAHAGFVDTFPRPFDLVFVDGERQVRVDCIKAGAARVKPGGWLLVDNSNLEDNLGILPDWPRTDFKAGGLTWVGVTGTFRWWTSFFRRPYDPDTALAMTVPALFAEGAEWRVLYVGASPHRRECLDALVDQGHEVTILEAWPENAAWLRENLEGVDVVEGDVRGFDGHGAFDAAIWWHGPEHVYRDELSPAVERLEAVAGLVVMAAPWGRCPQGEFGGNPHEAHLATLYEDDFVGLGYEVERFGEPDVPPQSFLVAWRDARWLK